MKNQRNSKYLFLLVLLPFLVVALLYEIIPLLMIVVNSFFPDSGGGGFTLEHYAAIFSKPLYRKAIVNSITISLVSSAIGIVIAFLGGMAARRAGKGTKIYNAYLTVLNMTSNFAGVPLAFAYMILLGNSGILKAWFPFLSGFDLYTSTGLHMIYVYFQIPLSTLLMIPAFDGIRQEWQEASTLMGCSAAGFWTKIGAPVLLPSILGTVSVLFANALAAYATAYALLMNNFALLPINVSGMFVGDVTIRRGMGGALSVLMMILMVIAMAANNMIVNRQKRGGARR